MDDDAIGLIAWILIGVGGLVLAIGATGGIMYAADTTVGAVVTDTQCAGGGGGGGGGSILGMADASPQQAGSSVSIQTKFPVPGIDYTMTEFDDDTCKILAGIRASGKEPFAEYSIRSGHTVLYREEGGACLYDSESSTPFSC